MRYLSVEDEKIVKGLIRGRMKFGIVFLLLATLIFGFMFFAGIFGNNHTEQPTIWGFVKLGIAAFVFYFAGIRFLILDSLKMYPRLKNGNYEIYIFEIYRCWRERHGGKDADYRYFLEACYLGDDGCTKNIRERIDCDDYIRIKDYKYAYVILFYKEDGKVVEYDNGIVLDSTRAGDYFFYKGTNSLGEE